MIRRAKLRSLAKINLDLRVLHKRPDGFHELRTVFQTISLADTITIEWEPGRRTEIELDDPLGIPNNIVVRAARAVLNESKAAGRLRLSLRKRIPMGAGLGGGSSNAAAVLLGLPVLAGARLDFGTLARIGGDLGSDVVFFLTGGTAVGVDRGTEIYPLPDVLPEPALLLVSGIHIPTGPAYETLSRGLTLTSYSRRINDFQAFVRALVGTRSAKAASAFSANDFERAVFAQHPRLRTLAGKLRDAAGGIGRMSGSGSALFALFGSLEERSLAERVLKRDGPVDGCALTRVRLVGLRAYRHLWLKQLGEHILHRRSPAGETWPPQSRYER